MSGRSVGSSRMTPQRTAALRYPALVVCCTTRLDLLFKTYQGTVHAVTASAGAAQHGARRLRATRVPLVFLFCLVCGQAGEVVFAHPSFLGGVRTPGPATRQRRSPGPSGSPRTALLAPTWHGVKLAASAARVARCARFGGVLSHTLWGLHDPFCRSLSPILGEGEFPLGICLVLRVRGLTSGQFQEPRLLYLGLRRNLEQGVRNICSAVRPRPFVPCRAVLAHLGDG